MVVVPKTSKRKYEYLRLKNEDNKPKRTGGSSSKRTVEFSKEEKASLLKQQPSPKIIGKLRGRCLSQELAAKLSPSDIADAILQAAMSHIQLPPNWHYSLNPPTEIEELPSDEEEEKEDEEEEKEESEEEEIEKEVEEEEKEEEEEEEEKKNEKEEVTKDEGSSSDIEETSDEEEKAEEEEVDTEEFKGIFPNDEELEKFFKETAKEPFIPEKEKRKKITKKKGSRLGISAFEFEGKSKKK